MPHLAHARVLKTSTALAVSLEDLLNPKASWRVLCATRGHPRGSSPYLSRLTFHRPRGLLEGFLPKLQPRAPCAPTLVGYPARPREGGHSLPRQSHEWIWEEGTLSRRGFFSSLRDVGSISIHPDGTMIRLRLTQTPWKKTHHPCQCSHQTSPPGWQRWHQYPAY